MAVLRTAAFAASPRARGERRGQDLNLHAPKGSPLAPGRLANSPHLPDGDRLHKKRGGCASRTRRAAFAACSVSSGVGLPHAQTLRGATDETRTRYAAVHSRGARLFAFGRQGWCTPLDSHQRSALIRSEEHTSEL